MQLYRKIDDFCNQIILDNRPCNITGRRFLNFLQMVTPPACTKLKEEDLQLSAILFDTASIT